MVRPPPTRSRQHVSVNEPFRVGPRSIREGTGDRGGLDPLPAKGAVIAMKPLLFLLLSMVFIVAATLIVAVAIAGT